jgi:hypothetical protein
MIGGVDTKKPAMSRRVGVVAGGGEPIGRESSIVPYDALCGPLRVAWHICTDHRRLHNSKLGHSRWLEATPHTACDTAITLWLASYGVWLHMGRLEWGE